MLERRFSLERNANTPGAMSRMFGGSLYRLGALVARKPTADQPSTAVSVRPGAETARSASETLPRPDAAAGIGELLAARSTAQRYSQDEDFVVCSGVSKSHGNMQILRSVDLQVKAGEVVVILVPSGSGKSTMLRLINHLEPIDGGEILVDGEYVRYRKVDGILEPTSGLAKAWAAARIGMVFQHFNLFDHLPVIDNVTIAPTSVYHENADTARRRTWGLLADVGLERHVHHLSHRLSGGQQQRVAIARALAITPKLMLSDEPTSALDPELVGDMLSVIRRVADAGMTMIMVTHEVRFARDVADKVMFMDDGVVEEGPPAQMWDDPQHERTRRLPGHGAATHGWVIGVRRAGHGAVG